MVSLLTEFGIEHRYTEVPECGHGCMRPEIIDELLPWLSRQTRTRPTSIDLTAHTLRHNRSHFVRIDAFKAYGQPALIKASFIGNQLSVDSIENIRQFSLGPVDAREVKVSIAGDEVGEFDLSTTQSFKPLQCGRGASTPLKETEWQGGAQLAEGHKRHGCSGPIGDIFFEPVLIVQGTQGSAHENFILDWLCPFWASSFKSHNGGVHRGVFDGESRYEIRVVKDTEVTDEELHTNNLILAGSASSNAVVERIENELPLRADQQKLRLHDREFHGSDRGAIAACPSPFNEDRLVIHVAGTSPKAVTGASHLNFQLLPDYLVWENEDVQHGFFDENWTLAD
jgi:hypothetical protein